MPSRRGSGAVLHRDLRFGCSTGISLPARSQWERHHYNRKSYFPIYTKVLLWKFKERLESSIVIGVTLHNTSVLVEWT